MSVSLQIMSDVEEAHEAIGHQTEPEDATTALIDDNDQTMADVSEALESEEEAVDRDAPDHNNTPPKPKGRGRPTKTDSQLQKKIQKLELEKSALRNKHSDDKKRFKQKEMEERKKYKLVEEELKKCTANSEKLREELIGIKEANASLRNENSELTETASNMDAELSELKCKITDLELEKEELMDQMAGASFTSANVSLKLAKGLIFYDECTEPLLEELARDNQVSWQVDRKDLSELRRSVTAANSVEIFKSLDLVLILSGPDSIRKGTKGLDLFNSVIEIAKEVAKHSKVVLVSHPPSRAKGASANTSLYNFKLIKKFDAPDNIQTVNVDFTEKKEDLLDAEDRMTSKCCETYAKQIMAQIDVPQDLKCNTAKPAIETKIPQYPVKVFVPVEQREIGRIIGKAGSTIGRLSRDFRVEIAVGRWQEPKAGSREDFELKTHAIIINGQSDDVKGCSDAVTELLSVKYSETGMKSGWNKN